jgi:hypothetical protein
VRDTRPADWRTYECQQCGTRFRRSARTGRKPKFCGDVCQKARIAGFRGSVAETLKTRGNGKNSEAISRTIRPPNPILKIRPAARWIKANELTWKFTEGEQVRVPAARGKWGGFNADQAVAWVIAVGAGWFARVRDERGD